MIYSKCTLEKVSTSPLTSSCNNRFCLLSYSVAESLRSLFFLRDHFSHHFFPICTFTVDLLPKLFVAYVNIIGQVFGLLLGLIYDFHNLFSLSCELWQLEVGSAGALWHRLGAIKPQMQQAVIYCVFWHLSIIADTKLISCHKNKTTKGNLMLWLIYYFLFSLFSHCHQNF